ncbi:class E sortase [Citricoccus sp. GCM10030269]|uniref:class E sortase n=1 Tax=Citricoccus sp. GCM10030269 TaxID=3273388 RepID=UPI003613B4CD
MTGTLERPPAGEGPRAADATDETDAGRRRPGRRGAGAGAGRTRRRPGALSVVGAVLIALGVIGGGYAVWELFVTDLFAESERSQIAADWRAAQGDDQLGGEVGASPGGTSGAEVSIGTEHREDFPVVEGDSTLGLLHVPRWGSDYEVPIGSSDSDEVLDTGQVGHYESTQAIGAVGNAGVAGHRTTHGKPLRKVHELQDGDALVVESRDAYLVYRVVARDIVKPEQSEVLDPVPPFEGATEGRYLTLTTCDPIFGITDRYIVWAEADYWTPKSEGIPPALA